MADDCYCLRRHRMALCVGGPCVNAKPRTPATRNEPYVIEPAGWVCYHGSGPYATRREAKRCHCLDCLASRRRMAAGSTDASMLVCVIGVLLLFAFIVFQIVWGVTA